MHMNHSNSSNTQHPGSVLPRFHSYCQRTNQRKGSFGPIPVTFHPLSNLRKSPILEVYNGHEKHYEVLISIATLPSIRIKSRFLSNHFGLTFNSIVRRVAVRPLSHWDVCGLPAPAPALEDHENAKGSQSKTNNAGHHTSNHYDIRSRCGLGLLFIRLTRLSWCAGGSRRSSCRSKGGCWRG